MFLFYNHSTDEFECSLRPFVLTQYSDNILGQFISSKWFNYKFNITQDITFIVVGVPIDMDRTEIIRIVKQEEHSKLHYHRQYSFSSISLEQYYNLLQFPSGENVTLNSMTIQSSVLGSTLKLCIRIYKDFDDTSNSQTKYVLLSHPNFECSLLQ